MKVKRNSMCISPLAALAICLSLATGVQAATITSSQNFIATGPTANTGDIQTADMFTFVNLSSGLTGTGIFSGMPQQSFGPVSFDTASGLNTSLSFGNSVFGEFTSASIVVGSTSPPPFSRVTFNVTGDWTPGTYCNDPAACPVTEGPFPALMTLAFTQTGGAGASVSVAPTIAVSVPEIPLPAALPLFATGIGGLGLLGWRRKRKSTTSVLAT